MKMNLLKSKAGFIGVMFASSFAIIFLFIVFKVTSSIDYLGKSTLIYQTHKKVTLKMKEIKINLNNFEACINTFGFNEGPFIEVSDIKDTESKGLFSLAENTVYLKKAILCFNEKAKETKLECKEASGVLKSVRRGSKIHYIAEDAVLYIKLFSELNVSQNKSIPIFIELDSTKKLLKCSLAVPALNSQKCASVEIIKTCCRHKYAFTIPDSDSKQVTTNLDGISYYQTNGSPSTYISIGARKRIFHPKGELNYIYSCLPSSSDPTCVHVKSECSSSAQKATLEAKCLDSGWNYQIGCKK